jgi:hypothetical protein
MTAGSIVLVTEGAGCSGSIPVERVLNEDAGVVRILDNNIHSPGTPVAALGQPLPIPLPARFPDWLYCTVP